MTFTLANVVLLAGAGLLAGAINAAAGGGSLISFPTLVLVGLPALSANVTNTVALSFGYAGGAAGFRDQLEGQAPRLRRLGAAAAIGALAGVVLIEISSQRVFRDLVPWLLLTSCALLAGQPAVARHLRAPEREGTGGRPRLIELTQILAGAYGAYFGAGLGVMVLALLGAFSADPLPKLNAYKSVITLVINVIATLCFVLIAPVSWAAVAVVGPASLIGGRLGAGLSKRIPSHILRWSVVALGTAVALRLLVA